MSGWDLLQGGRGLLAAVSHGATLAFRDAAELPGAELGAVDFADADARLTLAVPAGGPGELVACRASGTLAAGGEAIPFDAPALRWEGTDDAPGPTLRRSIAILLEDGGLVAVRTRRDEGAAEHGDEARSAAFTLGRDRQVDVGEVLLSTEYGADGVQRRATLELWPREEEDGDMPLRGAGVLICSATRSEGEHRRTVAFFGWSVEGRAGLGRYEIEGPA